MINIIDGCPAHCGRRVTATQWNLSKSMDRTRWVDLVVSSFIWHNTARLFFMKDIKKHSILGSADHTEKYEATNYWQYMQQTVRKCQEVYVLLKLNDCSVALIQTNITSNTFDVKIIVLFLYLMTNDLLL